ncbi:PQQ-dependent sugar dehydrogenase [Parasphingopyxis sp.]|uniref:PQQ-dependent sugar dehydrogenase n=1 Tax=Parasphingopyxis sp. TaxID=1920299 RepID=UPI00262C820E|nr:PQQ-dependent sugar dehydrogenase [Parasphingopyxis sp.]
MKRFLASAASILVLNACGGDGNAPPPPPPPANTAPSITSAGTAQVTENDRNAYQTQVSDPDGDTLTYSISGGADASLFSINSAGALVFNARPNFDLPADANQDNVYRVNVTVSDGQASDSTNLSITVENDREGIAVRRIASGLARPTYIAPIPGEDDVFVIEKRGRILRLDPATGALNTVRTVQDISFEGEGGLLGIAMPSYYPSERMIYIFVTNAAGDIELRRFRENGIEPPQGEPSLLTIPHPVASNHYGGWIGFDPDDLLFVATGDGGAIGGPNDNAQDPDSLLGKILRFGILRDPYAGASVPSNFRVIPPDNPFANGGGAPEIYALGLRNPFRASFSGDTLFMGDVGQKTFEEVNRLSRLDGAGTNFGWPFREGSIPFRGDDPGGLTDPVTEYDNGEGPRAGRSVIGGIVYDGPIVDLFGKYVFADFLSSNIWSIPVGRLNGSMIVPSSEYERRNEDFAPDVGTIDRMVALVPTGDGSIYIVDFDGEIFVAEPA